MGCVWLAFATSGFVFSEPAPVDAMMLGLIVLLPIIGMTRISGGLVIYLALWLIISAGHFLATTNALDVGSAATFSGVSLYLAIGSFVIAAFVAKSPLAHTQLIFNAWTCAALFATVLALIGYIGVIPGAHELFTKFGRASGSFKDPNVYGAFLVAPVLYMLHLSITRPLNRATGPLVIAGVLSVGVLLCFSRGAWINLASAILIYGYLAFVTASSRRLRGRIMSFMAIGFLLALTVIGAAMQFDRVANLMAQRASLVQNYDAGHEGRFGGQAKAVTLITKNPLGIGANEFGTRHHHEEVHNVYLSVVLNGGWLGGGVYWVLVSLTIALGLRLAIRPCLQPRTGPPTDTQTHANSSTRPLFLVAIAAFISTALEGMVIDTDHWRHFYVLMGLCWGLMNTPGGTIAATRGSIAWPPNRTNGARLVQAG